MPETVKELCDHFKFAFWRGNHPGNSDGINVSSAIGRKSIRSGYCIKCDGIVPKIPQNTQFA